MSSFNLIHPSNIKPQTLINLKQTTSPSNSLKPRPNVAAYQRNISQHCWAQHVGCYWLKFNHFQFWANNTQNVATRWPNARNMLRPTMLRYIALACCNRLAGALYSANEPQQGRNSCPLLRSCFIGSGHVGVSKSFSCSISLAVYCLYTFFWLIRSLVDPALAVFIVCGPLQFVIHLILQQLWSPNISRLDRIVRKNNEQNLILSPSWTSHWQIT